MALSNISKEHVSSLMASLSKDENKIEIIKGNHSDYAQLKLIAKQIAMLQLEAKNIIEQSAVRNELHKIKKTAKLVSGNYYYIYKKIITEIETEKYFSILSPEDWNNSSVSFNDTFIGKYYYDFDKQFVEC